MPDPAHLLTFALVALGMALLPQFISPERGSVLTQSLALGATQILVSVTVNGLIALTAGSIAGFLTKRPGWIAAQRWLMGAISTGLALRMATQARR